MKMVVFDENLGQLLSQGPVIIDNKPALVQTMTWTWRYIPISKTTFLKLHPDLPGTNELILWEHFGLGNGLVLNMLHAVTYPYDDQIS